nr:ribosomal protein S9 [Streptofilum sp. BC4-VF8pt]WKT08753.1 ribosomal protein S9 [Streptofilum sp. ZNP2-VF4pt]
MLAAKVVSPSTSRVSCFFGTGRRKSSVARVCLLEGTGKLVINNRSGNIYLQSNPSYLEAVRAPLETLGYEGRYDIVVKTQGGGTTGQAEAIMLGVARALCEIDAMNRFPLRKQGYLTRNSSCKERKKYGLKKARKAPQFSKR